MRMAKCGKEGMKWREGERERKCGGGGGGGEKRRETASTAATVTNLSFLSVSSFSVCMARARLTHPIPTHTTTTNISTIITITTTAVEGGTATNFIARWLALQPRHLWPPPRSPKVVGCLLPLQPLPSSPVARDSPLVALTTEFILGVMV